MLCIAVLCGIGGCDRSAKPAIKATNGLSAGAEQTGHVKIEATEQSTVCCDVPAPETQPIATPIPAPAPDTPSKYSERTKQFLEAAEKGRISLMLEYIKQGADVNDKDDDGQTALHKAVAGGHRSAVIALLTHGADMGERDAKGRTPLMVAAENGHVELVTILITPDSVKNLAGEALKSVGTDALKAVGLPGFTNRLEHLASSSIDLADQTGQTPIMKAAANGHLDVVKALANRADPTRRDRQGKTALMLAATSGQTAVVEQLAALPQLTTDQIQATDKDGKSALDLAAASGQKDVQLALRRQLFIKAAGEGRLALVKEIHEGKDPPDSDAPEALQCAVRSGSSPVVLYLMEKWKDKPIEERQRLVGLPVRGYGGTALAIACYAGNKRMVEALLEVAWWKDKAVLLDYITAKVFGNATVETTNGQPQEMVELLKSKREALQAELKK
jgi:ankyrin repeat protein